MIESMGESSSVLLKNRVWWREDVCRVRLIEIILYYIVILRCLLEDDMLLELRKK